MCTLNSSDSEVTDRKKMKQDEKSYGESRPKKVTQVFFEDKVLKCITE